jgi:hypothetical protein
MPQDDRQSQGHPSLRRESRRHVGLLQNPITDTGSLIISRVVPAWKKS